MTDLTPQINGHPVALLEFEAPNVGPWFARCRMLEVLGLSGAVTLTLGDAQFKGTIDPARSGAFADVDHYTLVAGGGGWGKFTTSRQYHNDAGVKRQLVAADLAKSVGEMLGNFAGPARFNSDYALRTAKASQILEDCAGGIAWYVDYAGVTQVGMRPHAPPPADTFHPIDWDPTLQMITFTATTRLP